MTVRRLLTALAVLLVLTAVVASLAPAPPVAPDPAPEPSAVAAASTVRRTLSADATGQRVSARQGQEVQLTVEGEQVDTVSIDALGAEDTVDVDSPAQLDLVAETPGSYPIVMLESGRTIGTLLVR
jgi:hypothetical protein